MALAPTLLTELQQGIGVGSATAEGRIPSLITERVIAPSVGLAQILGNVATALPENAIGPTQGAISAVGLIPTLLSELPIQVGVGGVSIDGLEPTLTSFHKIVEPQAGSVSVGGQQPTASGTSEEPRGHVKIRRSRYYGPEYVEVSAGEQPVIDIKAPPSVTTVVVADYRPDGVLKLDTSRTEQRISALEARRARIARMRREEEELIAILMRAA